jgi:hypothetical protein
MADQDKMGSDLSSPIDPTLLAWAEYWYPIAWKGLLGAGIVTALAACATIAFLLLQWRTSLIREQNSDWRTSVLETQAKRADADLLKAKSDIADADARAAAAQADAARAGERASALEVDAAKARERTAALEKETTEAKAGIAAADARAAEASQKAAEAQLALEKLKAPRTLTGEEQDIMISRLKAFVPQQYALSAGQGQEAENLLCLLDSILQRAGWEKVEHFGELKVDTACGTAGVNSISGVHIRISTDSAPFTPGTGANAAATLLGVMLNSVGIAAFPALDPKNIPKPNIINLMVGIKP